VPIVILLDWNMPDGRGDSLCQWIRIRWKELPIIFLTVRDDSHDIVSGFQNGADDYVVNPFELSVLYSRIQAVLRRTGNVAEQYLSCDGIMIDLSRRTVSCGSEEEGRARRYINKSSKIKAFRNSVKAESTKIPPNLFAGDFSLIGH